MQQQIEAESPLYTYVLAHNKVIINFINVLFIIIKISGPEEGVLNW